MFLPALWKEPSSPLLFVIFFYTRSKREREGWGGRGGEGEKVSEKYRSATPLRDPCRGAQKYSIPSCQTVSEILRSRGISLCISRQQLTGLAVAIFTEYLIATVIVFASLLDDDEKTVASRSY